MSLLRIHRRRTRVFAGKQQTMPVNRRKAAIRALMAERHIRHAEAARLYDDGVRPIETPDIAVATSQYNPAHMSAYASSALDTVRYGDLADTLDPLIERALSRPAASTLMRERYRALHLKGLPVDYHSYTDDPAERDVIASVLDETYGLILFRDQVKNLVRDVADFDTDETARLVKGISKKMEALLISARNEFFDGGRRSTRRDGVTAKVAFSDKTLHELWIALRQDGRYAYPRELANAVWVGDDQPVWNPDWDERAHLIRLDQPDRWQPVAALDIVARLRDREISAEYYSMDDQAIKFYGGERELRDGLAAQLQRFVRSFAATAADPMFFVLADLDKWIRRGTHAKSVTNAIAHVADSLAVTEDMRTPAFEQTVEVLRLLDHIARTGRHEHKHLIVLLPDSRSIDQRVWWMLRSFSQLRGAEQPRLMPPKLQPGAQVDDPREQAIAVLQLFELEPTEARIKVLIDGS